MDKIVITKADKEGAKHQNAHPGYEYFKKPIFSGSEGNKCNVAVYTLPPRKAAYPYHYHYQSEEVFFIVSGEGSLRTPDGERPVAAGDILAFPSGEKGAHKLTNTSETDDLVYIDFDTYHSPEISFMPDSGKRNIYGEGFRQIVPEDTNIDYYDGE